MSDYAEKKKQEIVNSNFGIAFVVCSNQKKIRFYPKKAKTKEQEEQSLQGKKNKERQARRRQAMERLMKRQEDRAKQLEVTNYSYLTRIFLSAISLRQLKLRNFKLKLKQN